MVILYQRYYIGIDKINWNKVIYVPYRIKIITFRCNILGNININRANFPFDCQAAVNAIYSTVHHVNNNEVICFQIWIAQKLFITELNTR